MYNKNKIGITSERLRELAKAISNGPEAVRREFTMSVPVQPERDADLVLSSAADSLDSLAVAREDISWLLSIVDRTFKLPVLMGLDPTGYVTLSYKGDLAIAQRIEEIRRRHG